MKPGSREPRIQLVVYVEVDPFEMNPVGPRIALDGTANDWNGGGVCEDPDFMTARGSQQSPEPDFQFRTLSGLARQGRHENLHGFWPVVDPSRRRTGVAVERHP